MRNGCFLSILSNAEAGIIGHIQSFQFKRPCVRLNVLGPPPYRARVFRECYPIKPPLNFDFKERAKDHHSLSSSSLLLP